MAAAMPTSETISCVGSPVTGVCRRIGHFAVMRASARRALLALDDVLRDVLCERLDVQGLGADDGVDRVLEELREARHVHALLGSIEVDRALDLGRHHGLATLVADAHCLRDAGDAGARERQPDVGRRGLEILGEQVGRFGHEVTLATDGGTLGSMADDFPRLVSLACHDFRTPLATMQGFAKTLLRRDDLDETTARWLGMIETAGDELVELIELLSVAARIEAGRYDPAVREVDSLEVAQAAVADASGRGTPVRVDPAVVERSLAALALAARRHGGVDVAVSVEGDRIAIEPVGPEVAPIVLGRELKDLGAAVAVRVVRAQGGSVELDGERLVVTLPAA